MTATIEPTLDHLVYAVPDLQAGVEAVHRATGHRPVEGGRHVGKGTRNYLLGLGGAAYLEIIGPDPEQTEPEGPRPFGLDRLLAPRLVTWAVAPADLDATITAARDSGYDPGDPVPMGRRTPAGDLLQWRLTPSRVAHDGLVPFLIDWGTTRHPASGDLPVVELLSFSAIHPDPAALRADLAALGVRLDVTGGHAPALTAVVRGADGPVTLT
ncbi:VOC family protein [Allostreptomyces psammosilenae]|uniref:Glyoxalase-like domain-containing protein n=1 Tax=Allostreptomyces psammosilenae TaxID=1892865 RepID=A0A853A1K3_9ACTN|nr:VOC family protein [Allostreptomyces psammosilenae]NYI07330.1 hypothetical protein [Allostreptomyces psammosilenae]